MNNIIKLVCFALALSTTASFADDCTAPAAPALPDGATATLEEMLAGQQAVKEYQAANTEYRSCLEPKVTAAQTAAAGDSPGPEVVEALQKLNEDYNASVSEEEKVAEEFNTELRQYKEANPS